MLSAVSSKHVNVLGVIQHVCSASFQLSVHPGNTKLQTCSHPTHPLVFLHIQCITSSQAIKLKFFSLCQRGASNLIHVCLSLPSNSQQQLTRLNAISTDVCSFFSFLHNSFLKKKNESDWRFH